MLAIRLARVGKKNTAQYKIVLQEHTVAPGGRHVEILGSYDPHSKKAIIKDERVKYWIEKGAQASDTAYNLLVSKGVIPSKKRTVKMPKKVVEATPSDAANTAPAEVKTEESKPEEIKAEETKAEIKPEEAKSEASTSAEATVDKPVETKPEEIKAEEVKIEEKVEEKKTEEVKAEEPKKE